MISFETRMDITNTDIHFSTNLLRAVRFPMMTDIEIRKMNTEIHEKGFRRLDNLASMPIGSGHPNILSGITVNVDMRIPVFLSPHLQRYHWIQYTSSQSAMHKIKHKKLTQNDFALDISPSYLRYLHNLQKEEGITEQELVNALPQGYLKWTNISTNYLQLKTIYQQRKNHKLPEWRKICNWIERLPHSYLITD